MRFLGIGTMLFGSAILASGLAARWEPVAVLGAGLVVLDAASLLSVLRKPRLALQRSIEPHYVEKGRPAVALVQATNLSGRAVPPLTIEQNLGNQRLTSSLPRLGAGQAAMRAYRLPTGSRGTFQVGSIDLPRSDPFGLWRSVQILGTTDSIRVHPRVLKLTPLTTGTSRNVEGPSSDASPQGSITFHRLREYVLGDDLRLVHWPSSAHLGRLVVRQNVDTAQTRTVVLFDVHPSSYNDATFEEAVDVTSSVVASMSEGRAPVELRTTPGAALRSASPGELDGISDYLTDITVDSSGSLVEQLALLRRSSGGTALVVVTGVIVAEVSAALSSLRRRFDRIIAVSIADGPIAQGPQPGIAVLRASSADEVARRWRSVATT